MAQHLGGTALAEDPDPFPETKLVASQLPVTPALFWHPCISCVYGHIHTGLPLT